MASYLATAKRLDASGAVESILIVRVETDGAGGWQPCGPETWRDPAAINNLVTTGDEIAIEVEGRRFIDFHWVQTRGPGPYELFSVFKGEETSALNDLPTE